MNSFYWAKTAFVSLLMISSITFEATCSGPVSESFNSLIVGITSANEGEHSAASISNQRPLELKLADAQMLQQWIGQIARKFVVEDGIFAGNYLCCPNININDVILTDGLPQERIKNLLREVQNLEEKSQFLKLLFSFGAMLSAEIGEQSQQNGTIRALLKAYECVVEQFPEEKNGISDFVIGAVIKRPIEQLKVDKIILKKNNRRHIQEFALLNASKIEMTPTDVINFAYFISIKFLNHFLPLFEFRMANLGDLSKPRRIAHQFLLHLKNWGPEALEEISLEDSDEDVIKLTQREKCIFGIFARNLLRRIAKFELLEDYFGELNISRLVNFVKIELKFYERLSAENCNEKSFPFFDEAIRIDWNVWTEIIQQIDELTKTVKSMDTKQVAEYLKRANENEGPMKIVKAKFDEKKFGLELKADVKMDNETMPKDEINKFCSNLATIRQICKKNITQYEKEIPFKRNVIIKQKENHNKFYDFIANVKHFGGNWIKNDNEESIEFDLNGAKSFLEKLYNSATNQIVKKNESEEYECFPDENLNFETAIRAILGKNLNEKTKNLLKEFYVPKEIVKIPRKSAKKEDDLEEFLEVNLEAQLFELLFSFAARLEAIVHGKNIDGTIEESRENPKDKIRAFLAVPNCFNVPEWANKFSIFDYWMEIKEINSKESQKMPVIGVAIYKELFNEARSRLQKNYKMLKSLNEQKFSIYESTKLLREIYNQIEKNHFTSDGFIIREMAEKLTYQIGDDFDLWHRKNYNYKNNEYKDYISGCEYAKLFQNISANFMKVEGVKWHMDKLDSDIQADVAMEDFGKYCKIIERNGRKIEETKISLLNNVRYDLVINFKLNAWKDVHDRTEDLLEVWTKRESIWTPKVEGTRMLERLYEFTTENRERMSKIEALKAKENDGYDLIGLFDMAHNFVRKIMEEEMPNLETAKEELETLERLEWAENDTKKWYNEQIEAINRHIQAEETQAKNLANKMNLLQNKLDEMPEKQRKNAAPFLEWLNSNGTEEITKETKQILQKICTLSELNQKVRRLKAKMKESQRIFTIELGDKLSMDNASTSQKIIENIKKLKMDDKITDYEADKMKNAQLKMNLVEEKLKVYLEKANEFTIYCGKDLLELAKENCKDLNKMQMREKMDEFEYEKMGNELAQQTDDILLTNGFEQKLDAILTVCKGELRLVEWYKSELNRIEAILKVVMKKREEMNEEISKIDKKLSEILMKKEVNTWGNKSKEARQMGKSLVQMLEVVKKYYGQKIDEPEAGERMELL